MKTFAKPPLYFSDAFSVRKVKRAAAKGRVFQKDSESQRNFLVIALLEESFSLTALLA